MANSSIQCERCHLPLRINSSTTLITSPLSDHAAYVCEGCERELDKLITAWFEGKKVKVKG